MPWARFEIISGLVDVLLILSVVVLLVRVRILRRSFKRLRSRNPDPEAFTTVVPADFSREDKPPVNTRNEAREDLAREQRLEGLIREAEGIRSELSILFYDVQRFLDDITPSGQGRGQNIPDGGEETGRMYPLPEDEEVLPSKEAPQREESMKETVLRLSREGRSIPEIASAVGRAEGEVAFLLSMEKVGRS